METSTRTALENILEHGSEFYRETALKLLNGKLQWSDEEISQFLDGFMNDPYLTRNE